MDVVSCKVAFNRQESPSVYRLGIEYDALARGARAARFLMLTVRAGNQQIVPRPFSLSDVWTREDGQVITEVMFKPIGSVTNAMADLRVDDEIHVGGLCGNGFPAPDPSRRPVLMAGGIGNAPFALQVRELVDGPFSGRASEVLLLLAGRTSSDIYIQDFARDSGIEVVEITEDGSRGEQGRVTNALLRRLDSLGLIETFVCGPEPMLRAVQKLALKHKFPCHLSVEERMACGYGVCNACVVEERRSDFARGQGWYLRACMEGPVFEAKEIHV